MFNSKLAIKHLADLISRYCNQCDEGMKSFKMVLILGQSCVYNQRTRKRTRHRFSPIEGMQYIPGMRRHHVIIGRHIEWPCSVAKDSIVEAEGDSEGPCSKMLQRFSLQFVSSLFILSKDVRLLLSQRTISKLSP